MPVTLAEPEKELNVRKSLIQFESNPTDEVVAFCPKCLTLETLLLSDKRLMPTQKFRQLGNRIYHACGSPQPCRLYRGF